MPLPDTKPWTESRARNLAAFHMLFEHQFITTDSVPRYICQARRSGASSLVLLELMRINEDCLHTDEEIFFSHEN